MQLWLLSIKQSWKKGSRPRRNVLLGTFFFIFSIASTLRENNIEREFYLFHLEDYELVPCWLAFSFVSPLRAKLFMMLKRHAKSPSWSEGAATCWHDASTSWVHASRWSSNEILLVPRGEWIKRNLNGELALFFKFSLFLSLPTY